ncbi:MAG: hypothetical protein ACRDGQ_04345, partial [Candidatus Limnocylindrales bacterium]
ASTRSYTYDLDGNRASKTEGGVTTSFVADRTDELVSETSGTTEVGSGSVEFEVRVLQPEA